MTRESFNTPTARNWRDIPQPVKPRAMSRGGRWRLTLAIARGAGAAVVVACVAWGGWKVLGVLQEDSHAMSAAAKALPVQPPELVTTSGGVLHSAWLARTLALPRGVSLMELDIEKLRDRVLAERQVLTAKVTRKFPDRLVVEITERMPVAQVMAVWGGRQQPLLVARDGVVFAGEGHDPAMVASLPWLDGINLVRRKDVFQPVAGMEVVDELLVKAQTEAAHLYRSWRVVSLARLVTDREIEITTTEGFKIVFGVTEPRASDLARRKHFIDQLSRLDPIWEKVAHLPIAEGSIDLSLGSEVPVRLAPRPPAEGPAAAGPLIARPASSVLPSLPSIIHREL